MMKRVSARNPSLALRLGLSLAGLLWAASAHAQGVVPATTNDKPGIRAVTAFVTLDRDNYAARMDDAAQFLARARTALNEAGFPGANGRVTTEPFPEYIKGMDRDQALALIGAIKTIAHNDHVALNVGPAMMNDDDDSAAADLLPAIVGDGGANANIIVADDKGLHWRAIATAAHAIHEIAAHSPNGNGNFGFAAIAMMKPYGPYYPGSWHTGPGRHFAIAMETANVVNRVFEKYHDPVEAQAHLTEELSEYTREAEAVAMKLAAETGWTYEGIDATPAPGRASIATAFESFLGAPIGSPGSETAAGIITRAVQATPVKRTGYSGLMIPVMEDKVLAQRWAEGTFSLDSILAWSAVCAGGVDTVPLAGSTSDQEIARIIGDVSWLAFRWNKPLGSRLMPSPGRAAGEMTAFTAGGLVNTRIH
ncbi:MAG TPA: DUF711 family protein [Rhizomicrobium sp.]|nr:DUF711 family protein [Rhizomicrobium sp.]